MNVTNESTAAASPSRLANWRPAWEFLSAGGAVAAAGATLVLIPGETAWGAAAAALAVGAVRTVCGVRVLLRRMPLAGAAPVISNLRTLARLLCEHASDGALQSDQPADTSPVLDPTLRYRLAMESLSPGVLFNARLNGPHLTGLYLGRGFLWTPAHAQALYELTASPVHVPRLSEKVRKLLRLPKPLGPGDIGSPILHGIGLKEESDIIRPLTGLGGGMLIVGTTQAGKGVVLTTLISQAILRGEPVIVIDPKSSKRLRQAIFAAADAAGRAAPLEFHPAFPDSGVRLDPLGAWSRPTEIATRIAAVLPADSGAFGSFAWMAVNTAVEGLFYVSERPTLLGLKKIVEHGVDSLLEKALDKSFRAAGITNWRAQVDEMDKRRIVPPSSSSSVELTAAVLLWEALLGNDGNAPGAAVIGGLIAVFRHNREHYAKITASLQPILSMLTSGTLGKSFSPDAWDPDDARPIVTVERVIEMGGILYLGLDALPDATVAAAMGSIILADLTSYAGKRYNRGESGTDVKRVSVFVDEASNVINQPMIELLNKGLEAGIQVTAAMQTVSDLSARLGNSDRARMALGNFNNLIALRSKDRATQEFICETFGKAVVWSTSASVSTGADGSVLPDFRASVTRSISGERTDIVPPDALGRLPNTEFFASLSGGRLYKGRMPILVNEDQEGASGREMSESPDESVREPRFICSRTGGIKR